MQSYLRLALERQPQCVDALHMLARILSEARGELDQGTRGRGGAGGAGARADTVPIQTRARETVPETGRATGREKGRESGRERGTTVMRVQGETRARDNTCGGLEAEGVRQGYRRALSLALRRQIRTHT